MPTDQTLALLREGYPWAGRVRRGADAAETRILGCRAVVVSGPEGVRRFYDPRLRRQGAVPLPVTLVLFGPGTVHGLDDAEHHHRKELYLPLVTPGTVAELGRRAEREWQAAVRRWAGGERVVLFDEAVQVLTASVLPWAGVPVTPEELPRRARQLVELVDGFGTPGLPYLRGAQARWRLDRWTADLVRGTRQGEIDSPPGSALHATATAHDLHGRLLPARTAGVALLNVLRPTVASAYFVAFAGRGLHEHPTWRRRVAAGDVATARAFAQEVRRLYPFVPVLAARARHEQDVLGVRVPRGGLVLLDVHGTDHDPAHWPDPYSFDPDRFLDGTIDPDTLVPQGGGDVATGHRCPGEDIVFTMLTVAVRTLAALPHTLPPQDRGYDMTRMPTRPRSGVVLAPEPGARA